MHGVKRCGEVGGWLSHKIILVYNFNNIQQCPEEEKVERD